MAEHISGYNQLSAELLAKVKPLKGNEQAIYQLAGLKTGRQVTTTEEGFDSVETVPLYPNVFIPATGVIQDLDGMEKPIGYISGYAPAAVGAINAVPTPIFGDRGAYGAIKFPANNNGMVVLTAKDNAKLIFFELCDWNMNSVNPNKRKPEGGYLFKRIHMAKEATKEVLDEIERGKTLASVTNLSLDELQAMAPGLGLNSARTQDEILLDVMKIVRGNVEGKTWQDVRDLLEDERTAITNLIGKAEEAMLLYYDDNEGVWKKGDTREVLAYVPNGNDHLEVLVDYLQKNAKGMEVRKALEKVLNKKAAPTKKKKAKTKAIVAATSRDEQPEPDDDDAGDDDDDDEDELEQGPPAGTKANTIDL